MWAVCIPENSENSGRDLLPNNIPILVLQYAIKVFVLRHVLCRIISLKEWSWVTFTFFIPFTLSLLISSSRVFWFVQQAT